MHYSTLSVKKEILIHILFWVVWLYFDFVPVIQDGFAFADTGVLSYTFYIVCIGTFYSNYLIILPKIFRAFSWAKLIGYTVGIFIIFTLLRYFTEEFLTVVFFNVRNYPENTGILYYFYDNLFFGSKPIILSFVLWLIIFMIQLLEQNKAIMEENKNTEIKFLKAQINPHFVFNTLNNIYSMVYFKSDKSLSAIEKLSHIMRFTTYEAQKDKIRLQDEIDYIKAYIELEQLRHTEYYINTDIIIENENAEIPPYIVSPLIENALKHGTASREKPIHITLKAANNTLWLITENETGTQKKDKLSGIGLDNLKRRVDIYYPKKHCLTVRDKDGRYVAELKINVV